jgi:hypothetical protein
VLARSALWPTGDTAEDAAALQQMLKGGVDRKAAHPLEDAMATMFSRDGLPCPPVRPDGSYETT